MVEFDRLKEALNYWMYFARDKRIFNYEIDHLKARLHLNEVLLEKLNQIAIEAINESDSKRIHDFIKNQNISNALKDASRII